MDTGAGAEAWTSVPAACGVSCVEGCGGSRGAVGLPKATGRSVAVGVPPLGDACRLGPLGWLSGLPAALAVACALMGAGARRLGPSVGGAAGDCEEIRWGDGSCCSARCWCCCRCCGVAMRPRTAETSCSDASSRPRWPATRANASLRHSCPPLLSPLPAVPTPLPSNASGLPPCPVRPSLCPPVPGPSATSSRASSAATSCSAPSTAPARWATAAAASAEGVRPVFCCCCGTWRWGCSVAMAVATCSGPAASGGGSRAGGSSASSSLSTASTEGSSWQCTSISSTRACRGAVGGSERERARRC